MTDNGTVRNCDSSCDGVGEIVMGFNNVDLEEQIVMDGFPIVTKIVRHKLDILLIVMEVVTISLAYLRARLLNTIVSIISTYPALLSPLLLVPYPHFNFFTIVEFEALAMMVA